MRAIILAAGIGKRMRGFSKDPKCLIKINNEPLIKRSISLLNKFNINDIAVVVGYKAQKVINTLKKYRLKAKIIENNDFCEGSILSLWAARRELKRDILLMDADLYFEQALIERLAGSKKKNFFLIDTASRQDKEAVMVGFRGDRAVTLARGLKGNYPVIGEWAGFLKLSSLAARKLKKVIEQRVAVGDRKTGYEFIIPRLFSKSLLSYELIDGLKWVEIDFPGDIKKARSLKIRF